MEDKYETKEIIKIKNNFKEKVNCPSLYRSSREGVKNFISKEISNYKTKAMGTINNSIAKKSVDADLKTEKKEIDQGIYKDTPLVRFSYTESLSKITLEKIKSILTSILTKWSFQTTNSNRLKTFYAKSIENNLEIFINFDKIGEESYFVFDNNLCYLNSEILSPLKENLMGVFRILTKEEDTNPNYVYQESYSQLLVSSKDIESLENWDSLKRIALKRFVSSAQERLLIKILKFLKMDQRTLTFFDLVSKNILCDEDVDNFILDNIKIDIQQCYA